MNLIPKALSIQIVFFLFLFGSAQSSIQFEGLQKVEMEELSFQAILENVVVGYLPYNPLILIVSSSDEEETLLKKWYPKGIIFKEKVFGLKQIDQAVDMIRLETDRPGYLLQYLHLQKTSLIAAKVPVSKINRLDRALELNGFLLISRWLEEELSESIFIKKEIYESIFQ